MWDPTHSNCHDTPVPNSGDLVTDLVYPDPLGNLGPLTVFLSLSVLDCDVIVTVPGQIGCPSVWGSPSYHGMPTHLGYGLRVGGQYSIGLGVVVASGRQPEVPQL